ncbi:MAG: ABC-2 family transporter protein, partial [Candidatus Hydromicrobium sp.]
KSSYGKWRIILKILLYYIKLYTLIVSQYIKSRMQYRADFFISSIGILLESGAGFFSLWVIFHSISKLVGWSYNEIIFDNIWHLSSHIRQGTFIKYYFRPLNMMFYYMSEVFDIKGFTKLALGIAAFIYASFKLGITWTFPKFILLLTLLFSSSLIMISLMIMAASTSFWTGEASSVLIFVFKFGEYSRYPVTIFNSFFKFLFTYIIPIGFVAFYPSKFFLRPTETNILAYLSPVAGILLFFLAYLIWKKGVNSWTGTGS